LLYVSRTLSVWELLEDTGFEGAGRQAEKEIMTFFITAITIYIFSYIYCP
jgi:hypothetical protein